MDGSSAGTGGQAVLVHTHVQDEVRYPMNTVAREIVGYCMAAVEGTGGKAELVQKPSCTTAWDTVKGVPEKPLGQAVQVHDTVFGVGYNKCEWFLSGNLRGSGSATHSRTRRGTLGYDNRAVR